jgi:adenylate cyclase
MKTLSHKGFHFTFLLFVLGMLVYWSGSNHDLRKRFQFLVFDYYNKILPREKPINQDVVIIDIDENSLRQIGQWPWPRTTVSELILNLKELGAKSVGFDMVFAEEDRTSPHKISQNLPDNTQFLQAKDILNQLPNHDQIFAQSIAQAGNIVTGFTSAEAHETRRIPHQPIAPTFLLKDKNILLNNVYQARGLATNIPKFSQSAAGNGHFMVVPEKDGIIRKVPIFARYNPPQFDELSSILYPLLALETLRVSIDPKARMIIKEKKNPSLLDLKYELKIGKNVIPVKDDGRLWVYFREIGKKEYIPAHFILDKKQHDRVKQKISGKIILIGTSAEGLRDIRSTPLQSFVAGVEVHANIIEQILQGKFLKRPDFISGAEALVLGSIGLFLIFLSIFSSLFWLGVFTFVGIISLFYGSWFGFTQYGLLIDPVYSSISIFLLFVLISLFQYMRSEMDRQLVKTAFGHYISPIFMEELAKNPDKLKLGGEEKELSVMFTDIRNFTKISEKLEPQELIELMNDFLTPMSNLVMESRGTIDKYMGDAMMAFWNAPLDDDKHAQAACETALAMNKALEPINSRLKEEGKDISLEAGIGINTGLCSVGNMGSKQRFAYSALGDSVNLASRLEGQTKTYGVNTLIGEDTYKKVSDLAILELDMIKVIGREKPVKIYTLIGGKEILESKKFKKWKATHNAMLAAYRAGDFDCAAQDCKDAKQIACGQLKEYYDIFMDRIIQMIKTPPPDNWAGVYVAKSK